MAEPLVAFGPAYETFALPVNSGVLQRSDDAFPPLLCDELPSAVSFVELTVSLCPESRDLSCRTDASRGGPFVNFELCGLVQCILNKSLSYRSLDLLDHTATVVRRYGRKVHFRLGGLLLSTANYRKQCEGLISIAYGLFPKSSSAFCTHYCMSISPDPICQH